MLLKDCQMEDFVNYKEASMFLIFPFCSFKCDKELGCDLCQNSPLTKFPNKDIDIQKLIERYLDNPITHAVVCGGLEPLDSWNDLLDFITQFRRYTEDTIVIYTGFYKEEKEKEVKELQKFKNIIIKFGRYIPNQQKHYDKVLGVYLASDNQYAEKIS